MTVGDYFTFLSEKGWPSKAKDWPPDVFALCASVLQKSGGYIGIVSDWPPPGRGTDKHEGARGFGGALLKINSPEVFGGVFVLALFPRGFIGGGVAPIHGVEKEATGTAGGVHDEFIPLGVQHP